jgi:NAD+ diphosphatase
LTAHHFFISGDRVLLRREGEALRLPAAEEVAATLDSDPEALTPAPVALRSMNGAPSLAYDLPEDLALTDGMELVGLRAVHALVSAEAFQVAGTAVQKLEWLRTHRFCGRCGTPSGPHPTDEARLCPSCGLVQYPRVSPAVIVLIERPGEMLLARSPRFRDGMYSTVAGFVEPGESLEDTVHREIREEVGVEVDDLRYFGSQPWPFPHSLMVGFVARWISGEIRVDGQEIEDAAWFTPSHLPLELPSHLSIARWLIEDFRTRNGGEG